MSNIYLLSNENILNENIINLPIFDIKYLDFNIDLTQYDGLIFTSKNAVYSMKNNNIWTTIPSYAIAKKTAKIIKQNSDNVIYTGDSGHGDDFANELISLLKNKKVLYIRAKKVVSNLVDILNKNGVICDELITYETVCKDYDKSFKPNKNAIIIFSSPSTIKCFFNSFQWDKSYLAIAIGKTTAKYFPKDINYKIADTTSLQSCIELAKQLNRGKDD